MRGNELLDKMELIDPAYVEAADTVAKRKKNVFIKWGAIAACLCLVAAGAVRFAQQNVPPHPDNPDLAPITIPELFSGMGFEGYLVYDASELDNGNPWSKDMNITSLPVYKNGSYDSSGAGVPVGLSEEEMIDRLNFAVSTLDLEVLSTETISDGFAGNSSETNPSTVPTQIVAHTDNGTVYISADGGISYCLPDEGLALPPEYNFTANNTSEDEAENALSYLIDVYDDFLGFAAPSVISSGDYNFYGELNRMYKAYDASGDTLEDILNYNFCSTLFLPNEKGRLFAVVTSPGLLLAEKLGDYPVLTVKEAAKRLAAGNYQTSAPYAFSNKSSIGKVELVYRTGRLEEVLLPYYRFYVLLPDEAVQNGLKCYGVYYVPAIADEYIANMPIYDGHFN